MQRDATTANTARLGRAAMPSLVLAGLVVVGAACGTTDEASRLTLPPMVTTTSTTVPVTTDPDEGKTKFYAIKAGESIAIIAARFQVPAQSIIDLNNIENPDTVQVGQLLEIPTDVVLIDDLPDLDTTSTEPA